MIRPEYAAIAREFAAIAADFGHDVDAPLRRDIARLASTMECIDRHVDGVTCDERRRALWTRIVLLLADGADGADGSRAHAADACSFALDAELIASVLDVRDVALGRAVLPRMLRLVREEIATSETMRHAVRADEYVAAVVREGQLTAALALLVAGPACGPEFRRFFFRLGGPANVVDKLLDARGDFARGELCLRPGLALHARLAASIAVRTPALFASHPRWWRVIGLGVRYLVVPPFTRADPSSITRGTALGTAP